jgi:diguanylate cyclase (GGDEF)-like protein
MHRLQTSCDHLTGVANRRTFYEAAELEIERYRRSPRPLSLILFDADFFKKVNDNFGHSGGDAVLRQFGALLMATFRQVDVVARLGGEEFAVLLPSADLRGATAVGERLRLAVETSEVDSDGTRIRYTVSGGIAAMDEDVSGLDELMKRADTALYAAKAAGRNRLEVWSANDPSRPVVSEG